MGAKWTEKEVVHLLSRATFYPGKDEVKASIKLGREETVRRLISGISLTDKTQKLLSFEEVISDGKNLTKDQIVDQQVYWLYRMINTQAPLIEKMTLFWHGHFATSFQKVKQIPLILQQNDLFRKYAVGNFYTLTKEISHDPAMMLYLDSNDNRKGSPNENYAREVMELFTLGIGEYSEQDVKETARALTGWHYDTKADVVKKIDKHHDPGVKTILGHTGLLDEGDVLEILFKQEAMPRFIVQKLLQFFVTERSPDKWVEKLAEEFSRKYDIGDTLKAMFLSDEFYAEEYQKNLIKTPVEYVAGFVKALDLPMAKGFPQAARKMGQELFLPPDVAGWKGGTTWLSTINMLSRYQFAESTIRRINTNIFNSSDYKLGGSAKPQEWVIQFAKNIGVWSLGEVSVNVLAKYAEETFIHAKHKGNGMRGLLQLIMMSPEAQMK